MAGAAIATQGSPLYAVPSPEKARAGEAGPSRPRQRRAAARTCCRPAIAALAQSIGADRDDTSDAAIGTSEV